MNGFQVSAQPLVAEAYLYWEGGQFDLKKKLINVESRQGVKRPTSNIEYGILSI